MFEAQCVVVLALVGIIRCKMEGYIVGGEMAEIEQYPYCAYLSITCLGNKNVSWMCGSSILNQDILLTAAHCLDTCNQQLKISISSGSVLKQRGHRTFAKSFIIHEDFGTHNLDYDIGLVKMKNRITFSTKSSRVALMRNPPMTKHAQLAGWGIIDEGKNKQSPYLMHLQQTVWKESDCKKVYGKITPGKICASCNEDQFAAPGDSGSALVIQGYIQIGLVSHKKPKISRYLIFYTNVSYYYDWIQYNARRLYCL